VWAVEAISTEARRHRRRRSEVKGFAARTLALPLILLIFDPRNSAAEEQQLKPVSTLSIQASSTPQILANHVHAIFQARCTECHGANLARPKGQFGYVLDLARVAANPKMVVPGVPAQSEIYQTVLHDEMPPPKSRRPPLTAEEKEIVKSWIEAGAPAALPEVDATTATPPLTLGRRVLRDLGQFHPPSTHFPIALLLVALPAEFLWELTRKDSWKTSRWAR
jgi:mono/diheme cytochrome c family protein